MLFKNGINLHDSLLEFIKSSNKLSIYIPYIKLAQLERLLQSHPTVENIIVRWEANDLVLGSSDLDIYPFLKEREIKLYRNPRLHLKAFVDNYQKAFIGSANISQRALNFPETSNYNYELGVIVDNLSVFDRLYFQTIEAESTLITGEIFEDLAKKVATYKSKIKVEDNFSSDFSDLIKSYLISALPMSYDVETLKRFYLGEGSLNEIDLNCALHDLAIYQIPFELSEADFISELTSSFFKHPFIKAFLINLDEIGEIYFGSAKEWIHQNCSDAPTPRKWEITNNIQILYRWIVSLGNGAYEVDRPNYSERLYKVVSQVDEFYIEKFINELNRDKAHDEIAPHQIILLISFFKLYHSNSKQQFEFSELSNEFSVNWKKHQRLFKSTNNNIGMPLNSLQKKGLIAITVSQPINDYRNNHELNRKIMAVSINEILLEFLDVVSVGYLENRITN